MKPRTDIPEKFQDFYILDKSIYDCMDAFMALLLKAAEFTLIPDLIGIFGVESAVKFIDIFSGSTIKVPSKDILQTLVRDANIYTELKRDWGEAKNLSSTYEISLDLVHSIFKRVDDLIEENKKNGGQ